ncbi:MAG: CDP-diacylglycerol O-phosphatidyltransferase [Acidobacteria bacterium]|nr:CDP-diacylglycerol O-phosphatidyltransferase [Acidobacteriota bacterium]
MAFLALLDAIRGDTRMTFAWLAVATFIDGTDGALARAARVKTYAATLDGARMDDIVDYLTFVFIPAFIVYQMRMVPDGLAIAVVAAMLLSSAFGFTLQDAKTEDHFFTGFPSYWNIVVLYMIGLGTTAGLNAALLLLLAALVFVRVGYIYPSRTPTWRAATLALGAAWAAAMIVVVWTLPAPPRALVIGSLVFPVYYIVLSLLLQGRRTKAGEARRET